MNSAEKPTLSFPGFVLMFVTTAAEPQQPLEGAFSQFVGCSKDLDRFAFFTLCELLGSWRSTGQKKFFFFFHVMGP